MSAVGLLPMALQGFDIDGFLAGAGMTFPGELARVTGLPRPEAGLGNRALVAEGYAVTPAPGTYYLAGSRALELLSVQPAGGRAMAAADYLRGHGADLVRHG